MKPIFKRPTSVEKTASLSIILENPPEKWEEEVLQLALKLHEWLSDFDLSVDFLKKVPDMRYGLGSITVSPKKPLVQSDSVESSASEHPLIHIPVIIKEGTLYPLDIFIYNGKAYPLEKELFFRKLSQEAEEGETTFASSDPTIIGYFWPPGRTSLGGPGAEYGLNVLSKLSSMEDKTELTRIDRLAKEEVGRLKKVASTTPILSKIINGELGLSQEKVAEFQEFLYSDSELRPLLTAVTKIAEHAEPRIPSKGIYQVVNDTGKILVRFSTPESFSLSNYLPIGPSDVGLSPTSSLISNLDVTAKPISPVTVDSFDEEISFNLSPGVYSSILLDGVDEVPGYFVSHIFDLFGNQIPCNLFYDATKKFWYYGPDLAIRDPKTVPLSFLQNEADDEVHPSVAGVFIFPLGDKSAYALPPMRLTRTGRDSFSGTVILDQIVGTQPIDIYATQAVCKPKLTGTKNVGLTLLIPNNYIWKNIGVIRKFPATPVEKIAEVAEVEVVRVSPNCYKFYGEKVSSLEGRSFSWEDAEFILANLGVPAERCSDVLRADSVKLANCKRLIPKQEKEPVLALDSELIKSASTLGDPNTVDAVLGLNLADHETTEDYLLLAADLENAQQKVARLLLLSRMGYYSIPEGAAKVVMSRLSPIINSLKVLALSSAGR